MFQLLDELTAVFCDGSAVDPRTGEPFVNSRSFPTCGATYC
jgi:hypothetical protein